MFLGVNYRDASLITLYFVVLGIIVPKIRSYIIQRNVVKR